MSVHPEEALFPGEKPVPVLAACEHFAGSEKLIRKSFALMEETGPIFNITCDCEDGAPAGREEEHAEMITGLLRSEENLFRMAGARVHDYSHPSWRRDADILLDGAADAAAYLTLPKVTGAEQAAEMIHYIQKRAAEGGSGGEIPIHILIETHGALREVWEIARLPSVQVLDFGLMDFISGHHGAVGAEAMRSPGQFEHKLIVRAKSEICAAALANGLVPSHNVTLDLQNPETAYNDALRAKKEFGFLRQWSIHPSQIGPIIDAMKPDYREVHTGAEVLLAARKADWGPVRYNGELYDRASYRYYWDLLRKARVTGVELPEEADLTFFAGQTE
jgi:citrate lyase subunit beta / citryl-CoA lyase